MATGRIGRFKEIFKFQEFRFIRKPFEIEEIREVINAYCDLDIGTASIELFQGRIPYDVMQKQIQSLLMMAIQNTL